MEGLRDSQDGWKYVIVLTKFVIQFVEMATSKSFGVLIPTMIYLFSTDASSLGLACSMPTSMMLLGSLPVAYILKSGYISPRVMAVNGAIISSLGIIISGYLTSVIPLGFCLALTGFGLSMGYLPAKVLLNDYFQDTFILMNSLGSLGIDVGALVGPVIIERALDAYGFSGAMLILGGISLHAIPASIALRTVKGSRKATQIQKREGCQEPLIDPNGDEKSVVKTVDDGEIVSSDDLASSSKEISQYREDHTERVSAEHDVLPWRQRFSQWFWHCIIVEEPLLLLSLPILFLTSFVVQSWILFLVPRAIWHGIPSSKAVLLSSIGGGGGVLGQILCIAILFFFRVDFIVVSLILSVISSTTFLIDPLLTSFPVMCVTAFIQGLCVFSAGISSAAFLKGSVSNENFTVAVGIFGVVYGIGGIVGSLLSGMIKDKTGSYTIVFIALGFTNCLTVILTIVFLAAQRRRDHLTLQNKQDK
ncbi:monocarboxylate transporter 6-like [Strongylocentrotus purpuratus]|uniref:Major facilitator superfamily (MFS) profile domain-containing protein n=1 Tax=Strongylocentrotus purpuratus TaxID=7668 RepID=A0A7M7NPE6_STRPU|nr:monocarboxylate transporter 6-like [Strongylocentrotus purpuratus]